MCHRSMASRHDGDHDARAGRKHRTAAEHDQPEEHDHSVDVVDEGDGSGQQTSETRCHRRHDAMGVGEREKERM